MKFHPKTSGAAVGAALGTLLVSVLTSIHGVSLSPEAIAAIPGFMAALGSWLVPADDPVPVAAVVPVRSVPPAPPAA